MTSSHQVQPHEAVAHSNIALIKYWGKRSTPVPDLNLPAVSSLSLTLDELRTHTQVLATTSDTFELDGQVLQGPVANKVFAHLDRIWNYQPPSQGPRPACLVRSTNHLPTAAGLASSASGFAALTLAGAHAFGLSLHLDQLSALARRGSGSAARSLWGGAVRLDKGQASDGNDCRAYPIADQAFCREWKFVICHTAAGPKAVGSTGGMQRCAETSPYYPAWVQGNDADVQAAHEALLARDLPTLGALMEHSCYKMHACMWATKPALMYWNHVTLSVLARLQALREQGLVGFATSDAGPHVKVLCAAKDADALTEQLSQVPHVHKVHAVAVGPNATIKPL